ncbi:histidine kinase dimerization/phospho-acceptor domain-containing protein [Litorimonas cladophorae]|uniref:histidine kinase dimerization/phospho-acceptor domain-containing protein n=1 Tax=Litorimonas cladophorae TaxID=1220491 RepID=UPI001F38A53E|nr:histidine kinase dimerization/phospho-acceptor domain-containing protein [Litorimonas cladophorae]
MTNRHCRRLRAEALEEIADSLPRAVAIIDTNSTVLHANKAAQKMLSPEMVGRPLGAFLPASALKPLMDRAFEGEISPPLSVHITEPTERYIDVDFSQAISARPGDTQTAVMFAVLADRTLAAKERELRADFLANASHELKTPIASLKGYIETLRGHAKDDPIAREKFLGIMSEQAERMGRLVTDLLSLRRIESSEHILPSETADVRKAIEAARNALTPLAETRDVNLVVNLPETPTSTTSGKTDECVQLFLNLMENAIKLSPPGSTVTTNLEYLPNWSGEAFPQSASPATKSRSIVALASSDKPVWRAIVSDEGPGVSPTHLPRIGERFYRIAGDLPAQEKGTGLGLAIVKHIVMRHRAGLFVQSIHAGTTKNIPSGTSFSIVFKSTNPIF